LPKINKCAAQFFHDERGQYSMSRLLCFLAFFPASYVVVATKSSEALGWYLSAYAAAYVGGKATDLLGTRKNGSH